MPDSRRVDRQSTGMTVWEMPAVLRPSLHLKQRQLSISIQARALRAGCSRSRAD